MAMLWREGAHPVNVRDGQCWKCSVVDVLGVLGEVVLMERENTVW